MENQPETSVIMEDPDDRPLFESDLRSCYFRLHSEVSKECKGGYLECRIRIPHLFTKVHEIHFSLYSGDGSLPHCNVLHVTSPKMGTETNLVFLLVDPGGATGFVFSYW